MKKIVEIVSRLAEPIVKDFGCELWDVEFVKEAGVNYLRVYIDKDGGVSINDCENVSRAMDKALDEADPIESSYTFEVSSAGADRQLKRETDFERYMGGRVEVRLYKARQGQKSFVGVLKAYQSGAVTIETPGEDLTFEKNEIAVVRLAVEF